VVAILTVGLAFIGGVALTHLYILAAEGRGPVALQDHRSMHQGSVVVGGGLPVLIAALAATIMLWPINSGLAVLMSTICVLAIISYVDDMKPMSRKVRFGVHIAAAVLCAASIPGNAGVFGGILPTWLDRALVVLALVWYINLYNFMDGIDGLAGAETAAVAGGYTLVSMISGNFDTSFAGLGLASAGAALGFLFWNWHPARIFLGDVGSIPLGLMTGWLMVDLAVNVSFAAAVILPLYFAADATLTILGRLSRGERIWEPHRTHFYQRAARAAGSHSLVVKGVIAANAVLVGLAVLAFSMPATALAMAALTVAALLLWMQGLTTRTASTQP